MNSVIKAKASRDVEVAPTSELTNIAKLQAYVDDHDLEAIHFFPGPDVSERDIELVAGVALELLEGWDAGIDAFES